MPAGTVLLHQNDPPGDIYVLESGRLAVETSTHEGRGSGCGRSDPGVVVGEVTLYTDVPRTADVVAEVPSVVLASAAPRSSGSRRRSPSSPRRCTAGSPRSSPSG